MNNNKEYEWINGLQAAELTGMSRSTLYVMIKSGEFPRPVKLGKRRAAWTKEIVLDWIEKKINESK